MIRKDAIIASFKKLKGLKKKIKNLKDEGIYKYFIAGGDPGVSFESTIYPNKKIEVTILGNRKFNIYELLMEIEKRN